MLENKSSNKRTRHVDVRYRFVTDLIEKKVMRDNKCQVVNIDQAQD